jgi:hypothetical protein
MTKINQHKPKYSFDEIVQIINSKHDDANVLNQKGYIGGMVIDDDGVWNYGVFLFEYEEVWRFDEEDLKSTGEFVPEDFNMSGETIKVVVNKKGEGEIK